MITRLKFLNSNTVAASCVLIWDGPCVQVVGFLAPVFPWPVMMGLQLNSEDLMDLRANTKLAIPVIPGS